MINSVRDFFYSFKQKKIFENLPDDFKDIVFYSESKNDWPHIGPIIEVLLANNEKVTVLSSDKNDLAFKIKNKKFKCFYIGSGIIRILLFQTLDCKILTMTMPDLDALHLKKSKHNVHYIYTFHSLTSSHTIYREDAFDAYDSIFAAGPHHIKEIDKREDLLKLNKKNMYEVGYPRIDQLIQETTLSEKDSSSEIKIVLAPTWGTSSILENKDTLDILKAIISTNYFIFIRIHPMTVRHNPDLIQKINKIFQNNSNFEIESDLNNKKNLYESDLMISDWSGAALEYAFTQNKPVLYIDTPQKINNQSYQKLDISPIETTIREEIGLTLPIKNIGTIKQKIDYLLSNKEKWKLRIKNAFETHVFNRNKSAEIAYNNIVQIRYDIEESRKEHAIPNKV
jgi:hypothetical protein